MYSFKFLSMGKRIWPYVKTEDNIDSRFCAASRNEDRNSEKNEDEKNEKVTKIIEMKSERRWKKWINDTEKNEKRMNRTGRKKIWEKKKHKNIEREN